MSKVYTENDLLLYIYKELSESESLSIESALLSDPDLNAKFLNLKSGIAVLDKLEDDPSPTSVNLIMEYAQKMAEKSLEKV